MSEAQLRLKNRNMYHGEYIGRYDGEGEFSFPDHLLFSKVKGWFKKGKIQQGVLEFEELLGIQSQRITVEGYFLKNNKFQNGKLSLSNGSVYEGDLKNFCFHGRGKQTWRKLGQIQGSYLHGKIDGYAELTSDFY